MIRTSTGLASAMMSGYGLRAMMGYGSVKVYTGAQPEIADFAPTGTHLGNITQDGLAFNPGTAAGGLQFANTFPRSISKSGTWRLKGITSGIPGWFRWVWNGEDLETLSSYFPRIDGAVGSDMILSVSTITAATDIEIGDFRLIMADWP